MKVWLDTIALFQAVVAVLLWVGSLWGVAPDMVETYQMLLLLAIFTKASSLTVPRREESDAQ